MQSDKNLIAIKAFTEICDAIHRVSEKHNVACTWPDSIEVDGTLFIVERDHDGCWFLEEYKKKSL